MSKRIIYDGSRILPDQFKASLKELLPADPKHPGSLLMRERIPFFIYGFLPSGVGNYTTREQGKNYITLDPKMTIQIIIERTKK